MGQLNRRAFLQTASVVSAGFFGLRSASGKFRHALPDQWGPLVKDPRGILDLAEGFRYRILSRVGDRMSDGLVVPGMPDGMAAFPGPDGTTVLIRNHECEVQPWSPSALGKGYEFQDRVDLGKFYDAGYGKTPLHGGTTTIVYDNRTGKVLREFLSLGGTHRNCAGGATPWGSWLTCEESVQTKDATHEQDHGWVFEVRADAEMSLQSPVPLKAMGRFNHEAVAVDPQTGIVYLTEDRNDSLIYRFIPKKPGDLARGGQLQMLGIVDKPGVDTRNHDRTRFEIGSRSPVRWMDCDDVESPDDSLRTRGALAGAAVFARGEGIAWSKDGIYIVSTSGGKAQRGQVWRYKPSPAEGSAKENDAPGILELFIEPNDQSILDMPDNCTIAPWGDLILCEDGYDPECYLLGVRSDGEVYKIGRNARSGREFAGCTFSPDGRALFVNLQIDGITVAIEGPWPRG